MNSQHLLAAFDRWREAGRDLVLATVYDTAGSTYSKAGARMLIDDEGNFQGMLSGGCLEGDLAERAAAVLASGEAQAVTYDLGGKDEELWGLGVGCDGLMRIFLQPLLASQEYAPFPAMQAVYAGDRAGAAATVLACDGADALPGATLVVCGDDVTSHGIPAALEERLAAGLENALAAHRDGTVTLDIEGGSLEVLHARLLPPPRVLVLGGGLDALPVVQLILGLGWRVCVQDHRPAYLEKGGFAGAEAVYNHPAAELARHVDLGRFDAAIVMSHHLQSDRCYLDALADSHMAYIGLLGPVDRRRRLQDDLGERAALLAGRVHGPAGIDIGGRGPAAIALSIVAEMHQVLLADGRWS